MHGLRFSEQAPARLSPVRTPVRYAHLTVLILPRKANEPVQNYKSSSQTHGSGDRIRTYDLVVTLIPILSYRGGLSHHPIWMLGADEGLLLGSPSSL